MPGIWVNGHNVLATNAATKFAIPYALNQGPLLLEMETHGLKNNTKFSGGQKYHNDDQIEAFLTLRRKNDPIEYLRRICLRHKLIQKNQFMVSHLRYVSYMHLFIYLS